MDVRNHDLWSQTSFELTIVTLTSQAQGTWILCGACQTARYHGARELHSRQHEIAPNEVSSGLQSQNQAKYIPLYPFRQCHL